MPAGQTHVLGGLCPALSHLVNLDATFFLQDKHRTEGTVSDVNTGENKHKSGMEPANERVRDMTEVAKAKGSPDDVNTRKPEVGFPDDK